MLPFRIRRFISRKITNYTHQGIKGYNYLNHVPVRNKKGSYLIEKAQLLKENNAPLTFVIISDANYFSLTYEQIQSIFIVEPQSEVFLYDIGLNEEQKKLIEQGFNGKVIVSPINFPLILKENYLEYNEGVFFLKISAFVKTMQLTQNKIIIYSDSANIFLKPLHTLKNFIVRYGFYAGMTTSYIFPFKKNNKRVFELAENIGVNIYDKRFLVMEGGIWAADISSAWVKNFIQDYFHITNTNFGIFHSFPHDMGIMSILLAKYLIQGNITLNELPNIRFNAILEKRKDIEKNMVVFDYNIEKVPFFGYACHNCSNDPDAPPKRRCTFPKADFKEYIQQ